MTHTAFINTPPSIRIISPRTLTAEGSPEFIYSFSRLALQLPSAFGSGTGGEEEVTSAEGRTPRGRLAAGEFPRGARSRPGSAEGKRGAAAGRGRSAVEHYLGASG